MTNLPPPFYDIFLSYFQSTNDPTLAEFVETHEQTILAYHVKGENPAVVWPMRYGKAQSFFYKNILKRTPPKVNTKNVNFGEVALKILSSEAAPAPESRASTSTSTSTRHTSASTSTSSGSNKSAAPVSSGFLDSFRSAYESMAHDKKWTLATGKVVEDEIFRHGLQCQFEDLSHSFIIDPSDPLWKSRFTNDEIQEMRTHKAHTLPPCPAHLLEYLNQFSDLKTLDALIGQTRKRQFDFDQDFDLEWAQFSIIAALRLFQAEYFPLTDQTEADIIRRIWSFIETAFDDVDLDVRCGEKESIASSHRKNRDRSAGGRKKHGHKTDLLIKCNEGELLCAEVGRKDDGDNGTKELHELGLKCPKMMKDQLCHLLKAMATPHNKHDLAIAGFVMMGLKLRALVLDRPSTYMCRIQKTQALFFPSNIETIGAKLGALLALVAQVKQLVCETFSKIKEPVLVVSQGFDNPDHHEDLPFCPTSP